MFSAEGLAGDGGAIELQQPRPAAVDGAEDGVDAAGVVNVLHVVLAAGRHFADVGRAGGSSALMRSMSYSMPASRAMARMCSTVFVLPPIAMSRTIALSIESWVTISRGSRPWPSPFFSKSNTICTTRLAARRKSFLRSALVASSVPLVGRAMPSASHRQFMLLAVNMPEQEPQVGQPACSNASRSSALELAALLGRGRIEDVDQVDRSAVGHFARLHRSAADEDGGDVAAHGAHQHAGHDLVAVGDADHAVETMGAEHRLDRVGDQLAAGQRELHPLVAHGDAVVHADRVEDKRHAARLADALLDELADLVQVDVAGDDVDVAVADGDERLAEIVILQAGGAEQASMGGPGVAQLDNVGSHERKSFEERGLRESLIVNDSGGGSRVRACECCACFAGDCIAGAKGLK